MKETGKNNITLKATCSICGRTENYMCDEKETQNLIRYQDLGRTMGYIQDIFPNIPSWIRSGAIDQYSGGFCICPECCN